MCLSSLNEKLTDKYRKKRNVIAAYKVVAIKKNGTAIPLYRGTRSIEFVRGVNVSRPHKVCAAYGGRYTSGFHMFEDFKDASFCAWGGCGWKRRVIKVFINPKDVLHVGKQGVSYDGNVIVASKITIRSLKPV